MNSRHSESEYPPPVGNAYVEPRKARRRRDRERMVKHAIRICLGQTTLLGDNHEEERYLAELRGRYTHDYLKARSCRMCGNYRRNGKGPDRFTIQEQRWLAADRAESMYAPEPDNEPMNE